jgi:general secretion pathway protein I
VTASSRRCGFTLIQVLVALASSPSRCPPACAHRAGADGASSLKARTLALWVAENRLAQAQLEDPAPAPGTTTGEDAQAGVLFAWRRTVAASPNPAFRKIEIVVAQDDQPGYVLARLVGYVGSGLR